MAWILPALAAGVNWGLGELQRGSRNKSIRNAFDKFRPPKINFGNRRNIVRQEVAEDRNRSARGFGESMAARGVEDAGAATEAGRMFMNDASQKLDRRFADIQDQEDAYNRAVAQWEAERALALAGQPDAYDTLGDALQTGASTYMLANQDQVVPNPTVTSASSKQTLEGGYQLPKLNSNLGSPRQTINNRFGNNFGLSMRMRPINYTPNLNNTLNKWRMPSWRR